jgi:hypothetical protein
MTFTLLLAVVRIVTTALPAQILRMEVIATFTGRVKPGR